MCQSVSPERDAVLLQGWVLQDAAHRGGLMRAQACVWLRRQEQQDQNIGGLEHCGYEQSGPRGCRDGQVLILGDLTGWMPALGKGKGEESVVWARGHWSLPCG